MSCLSHGVYSPFSFSQKNINCSHNFESNIQDVYAICKPHVGQGRSRQISTETHNMMVLEVMIWAIVHMLYPPCSCGHSFLVM